MPTPEEIPAEIECFCGWSGSVCEHVFSASAAGATRLHQDDEIRAAVQAENKKLCRINDTWDGVAASLGQIGFAIGVLDPRGESQGGLEALMYGLSAAIRDRGGVES
jgi:hypothetical protein